ncbi:sigma-70 family RNA polymerase sigma factor [soil metagenome]
MSSPVQHNEDSLESFRPYLRLFAGMMLDKRLQGKVDLSGVVQLTLLEAWQREPTLSKQTEAQRAAWLRKALTNNLLDEVAKFRTEGRDFEKEVSLPALLEESSLRIQSILAREESSVGQRLSNDEQLQRLAQALAQLRPDQARAVELHFLLGCTLAETGEIMNRSEQSVVGLVFRGIKKLRERFLAAEVKS